MTSPFSIQSINRRTFLQRSGLSLGTAALAQFMGSNASAAQLFQDPGIAPGVSGLPHYPPKIKRVIFLCMAGGPSQLETFDYKPKLAEMNGQPMPESFTKGQPIAQLQGQKLLAFGPQFAFQKQPNP